MLNPRIAGRLRAVAAAAGVLIAAAPLFAAERPDSVTLSAAVAPEPVAATATVSLVERFKRDPYTLARLSRERYDRDVREYSCVLLKQERIDGKLKDVEEIAVRFRRTPTTVYMNWLRNEDQVRRCLFVDSPEFIDKKGRPFALVEPAGLLIRLIVSQVEIPIHDEMARRASRRTIDEFGFGATLNLLDKYNTIATQRGVLQMHFAGDGVVDGRPTYIIERYLPYTGPEGEYPDAKLVIHFDKEWLLPVLVRSYADRAGNELLGSYEFTKIRLNPGFTPADFKF